MRPPPSTSPSPKSSTAEVVVASGSLEGGVFAWDLASGNEVFRFRSGAATPHGLASVAGRFLAAAQPRESNNSASAPVFYWLWNKPQVAVKSFPNALWSLIADVEGDYLIGGGFLGEIYIWEVASGELLVKWHAHYRAVTCLVLCDSLLISGSQDGGIKVWNLVTMLDTEPGMQQNIQHTYSFDEHALCVTDIVYAHGSVLISSSEDHTCKIWSLSQGRLLRSISFLTIIDALAVDPRGHTFYAGSRDGQIYITSIGVQHTLAGGATIGILSDNSKGVTCLTLSKDGTILVSGSDEGLVRFWDIRSKRLTRKLKYAAGPVSNVLIVKPTKVAYPTLPALHRTVSTNESDVQSAILPQPLQSDAEEKICYSADMLKATLSSLEVNGCNCISNLELNLVPQGSTSTNQEAIEWKQRFLRLQNLFVDEVMNEIENGT